MALREIFNRKPRPQMSEWQEAASRIGGAVISSAGGGIVAGGSLANRPIAGAFIGAACGLVIGTGTVAIDHANGYRPLTAKRKSKAAATADI